MTADVPAQGNNMEEVKTGQVIRKQGAVPDRCAEVRPEARPEEHPQRELREEVHPRQVPPGEAP